MTKSFEEPWCLAHETLGRAQATLPPRSRKTSHKIKIPKIKPQILPIRQQKLTTLPNTNTMMDHIPSFIYIPTDCLYCQMSHSKDDCCHHDCQYEETSRWTEGSDYGSSLPSCPRRFSLVSTISMPSIVSRSLPAHTNSLPPSRPFRRCSVVQTSGDQYFESNASPAQRDSLPPTRPLRRCSVVQTSEDQLFENNARPIQRDSLPPTRPLRRCSVVQASADQFFERNASPVQRDSLPPRRPLRRCSVVQGAQGESYEIAPRQPLRRCSVLQGTQDESEARPVRADTHPPHPPLRRCSVDTASVSDTSSCPECLPPRRPIRRVTMLFITEQSEDDTVNRTVVVAQVA